MVGKIIRLIAVPGTQKGDGCYPADCNGQGKSNGRDASRQDTSRQLTGWVRVKDPSKLGDIMPVGFGNETVLDDEITEDGEGRNYNNHGPQWVGKEGKKDGFVSTLARMTSVLPEGKPLCGYRGGRSRTIGLGSKEGREDPDAWEMEISKDGRGGAFLCIQTAAFWKGRWSLRRASGWDGGGG